MDLVKAKKLLQSGAYSCVLCRGDRVYTSQCRGVKPLVQWLENGTALDGFSAADKVIGKATAFLYVLLGVKKVYAPVISKAAQAVLLAHGIELEFDSLAEHIINRKGDGICPFEAAVLEPDDPHVAYSIILQKMRELNIPLSQEEA